MSIFRGIGFNRHRPPIYDDGLNHEGNFDRFFDWAMSLRDPMRQVPEIGEELGFGIRRHPLGFLAVYLSERDGGIETPSRCGIARVNVYPPGDPVKDDIHSHGFDFKSGVAEGVLLNERHFPDFSIALPDGEGYVGYETRADHLGQNHTMQATDAVLAVPRRELQELNAGDVYSMRARVDFHSVSAGDKGALTIFCKTPTYAGSDGVSLMLKPPTDEPPPASY